MSAQNVGEYEFETSTFTINPNLDIFIQKYQGCLQCPVIGDDVFDRIDWIKLLQQQNWDDEQTVSLSFDLHLNPTELSLACKSSVTSTNSPFVIIGGKGNKQFIAFVLIVSIPQLYTNTSLILKYQDKDEKDNKLISGFCPKDVIFGDIIQIIGIFYEKPLIATQFGLSQEYLIERHIILNKPTITYDTLIKYPWTSHSPCQYQHDDDGIYDDGRVVYPTWMLDDQ